MSTLDQLFADVFEDLETVGEDTPFTQYEGWDSLKHVELVSGIERRFDLDLSADEIREITSRRAARAVLAGKGVDV
jgi:acyl carrier protein